MVIDLGVLVAGTVLGLLLGGAIISLLVLAAVSTAKENGEQSAAKSSLMWSQVAKYEHTHMRTLGHDSDNW